MLKFISCCLLVIFVSLDSTGASSLAKKTKDGRSFQRNLHDLSRVPRDVYEKVEEDSDAESSKVEENVKSTKPSLSSRFGRGGWGSSWGRGWGQGHKQGSWGDYENQENFGYPQGQEFGYPQRQQWNGPWGGDYQGHGHHHGNGQWHGHGHHHHHHHGAGHYNPEYDLWKGTLGKPTDEPCHYDDTGKFPTKPVVIDKNTQKPKPHEENFNEFPPSISTVKPNVELSTYPDIDIRFGNNNREVKTE